MSKKNNYTASCTLEGTPEEVLEKTAECGEKTAERLDAFNETYMLLNLVLRTWGYINVSEFYDVDKIHNSLKMLQDFFNTVSNGLKDKLAEERGIKVDEQ